MKRLCHSLCLFILVLLAACSGPKTPKSHFTIKWNKPIDSLLHDTTSHGYILDSLRKQVLKATYDTDAINVLNALAAGRAKANPMLTQEAIKQSQKLHYNYGIIDATCQRGVAFCRNYQDDSADKYFSNSLQMAKAANISNLIAQAYSWKGELYRAESKYTEAIDFYNKAISICNATGNKRLLAVCYSCMADSYRETVKYDSALVCENRAIKFATETGDIQRLGFCYSTLGNLYSLEDDYPKALDYFSKAIEISRRLDDEGRLSYALIETGETYRLKSDLDKAVDYFNQGLELSERDNAPNQVAFALNGLADIAIRKSEPDKAIGYYNKALKICDQIDDQDQKSFCMLSIGNVFLQRKNYDSALYYYTNAIEIAKKIGQENTIAPVYESMSTIYGDRGDIKKANEYAQLSLQSAQKTGSPENIESSAAQFFRVLYKMGDYKRAIEMLNLNIKMEDSINNIASVKKFAAVEYKAKEDQLKNEQDKKDAVFKAEEAKKEAELKRQKTIRYAFTGGFLLVLLLAITIFRSLQQNRKKTLIISQQKEEVEKQKHLVETQKNLVELKNKEVTDSINYAKRLQDAILPSLDTIKQSLPESFVLYKPKDIVAGDFYWMEQAGGATLIAACDCTGHGVPGALVSVVCSNALNRAVKEFGLTEPGKILDKTRELVIETFDKSEGNIQDGMDISLLSITAPAVIARNEARLNDQVGQAISKADKRLPRPDDGSRSDDLARIEWSGAYNPLWIVQDGVLNELAPDKQPIGKTDNAKPFTTHSFSVNKGDSIYLFTDGFADQFGGPKGKKFKYKQLQELLIANSELPMPEQKKALEKTFDTWKGELEQVDDVLIIGIRV